MGEVIWIEVLSRHRDVVARHRCEGPDVYIGRGYDNDVVLDDPYVAPRHVRIYRNSDGALIAEDLGSVNGLMLDGEEKKQQRIALDGNKALEVGHTLVRIRAIDFPIAPERRAARRYPFWSLGFGALALLIGLGLLEVWLNKTAETRISEFAMPTFFICVLVVGWATIWAVLTRIFAGHAHFSWHLFLSATGALALTIVETVAGIAAFSLSFPTLAEYEFVIEWLIFGFIILVQSRSIIPAHPRIKFAIAAAVVLIGIGLPSIGRWETQNKFGDRPGLAKLKPASIRIVGVQSEDDFFSDVDEIKKKLARDRLEPPRTGGGLWSFDDDE